MLVFCNWCIIFQDSQASLIVHLFLILIFMSSFYCMNLVHLFDETGCSSRQFAHYTREHWLGVWGGGLHCGQVGGFL